MDFNILKFIFVLFFGFYKKIICQSIIKMSFNDFLKNISINNNNNIFTKINQENQIPLLCNIKLDDNMISKKIIIDINNEKKNLYPIPFIFYFNERKLNLNIYSEILQNSINCTNTFSLPYKFLYDENNIFFKLKNEKIISSKSYAIEKENITKNNYIYLGGIPRIKTYKKYSQNCQVDKKFSSWVCKLNSISFKNENYIFINKNDFLSFNFDLDINYISDNFYNYLLEYPFKNYISNKTCYIQNYIIYCDCNLINKKIISFIIYENTFELYFKQFLKEINHNKCQILFEKNPKNRNLFVLGSSFLENYITLFNYETEYITFISNNPFIIGFELNFTLLLMLICCFILIFQTIYLSIILSMTIGCDKYKLLNLKENGIFEAFNENRTIKYFIK